MDSPTRPPAHPVAGYHTNMQGRNSFFPGKEGGPGRPAGSENTPSVKKMITHDLIIDYVLANPRATNKDIGAAFGYSAVNIGIIMHSDAFQARYHKRQGDLVDPIIAARIEDRITALAVKSAEIVHERLEENLAGDHKFALEVFKESTRAAGLGQGSGPQVNTQFVVHLPGPASSTEEWSSKFAPQNGTMLVPRLDDTPSEADTPAAQ